MDKGVWRYLVLSILLHILFFIPVIFWSDWTVDQRWSGGAGDGGLFLGYIDLKGDTKVFQETPKSQPSSQKTGTLKIKEKKSPSQKTATPKRRKQKLRSSYGKGTSDTPAGGVGQGADADGVVSKNAPSVLALIRKKILQQQSYPTLAREKGWAGVVKVAFVIQKDGSVTSVRVVKSSGYSVLDNAATKAIRKAAPLPYYPGELTLSLRFQGN